MRSCTDLRLSEECSVTETSAMFGLWLVPTGAGGGSFGVLVLTDTGAGWDLFSITTIPY